MPLTGRELRGCWTAPLPETEAEPLPRVAAEVDPGVRLRGFVPVELVARSSANAVAAPLARPPAAVPVPGFDPAGGWTDRTTLFGDAEA
jgi:hypothetical protein